MKIVHFHDGLGNQIFTYLFYLYTKETRASESIFITKYSQTLHTHHGFELTKVFRINDLRENPLITLLGILDSIIIRKPTLRKHITNLSAYKRYVSSNILKAYWMNQKYYRHSNLQKTLQFRTEGLSAESIEMAKLIEDNTSVAIHIRRGDYLNADHTEQFGGCCTEEYYRKSIAYIKALHPEAKLYFFSDDMDWVRQNMAYEDSVYVDFNRGNDSWQDMYLMSLCRHHIIANSTFSYWGAMLATDRPEHIVIAPKKWYIWKDPDIFPEDWIRF